MDLNACLNRETDDWPMDFWVDKPIPLRKPALCVGEDFDPNLI